jgi:uncharacterized protein (DUF2141 family)
MIGKTSLLGFSVLAWSLAATPVQANRAIGPDAAACNSNSGPAIRVNVSGLKDRTGRLKLELWNATEEEFLKDDRDLKRDGQFFHRVWADMPSSGAVTMCIKAPKPGRYALLFTHDRDGKNKFNFWQDGAGFPSNTRLGRSRPKLAQAVIDVPAGVKTAEIKVQYLRGIGGFSPAG